MTKNNKVLIADDQDMNLFLLKMIFKDSDYIVDTVTNGEDALSLAKDNDYCIYLLDLHMPDMKGIEIIKTLRKEKNNDNLPVIFITADLQENELITECKNLNRAVVMNKPFKKEILFENINQLKI